MNTEFRTENDLSGSAAPGLTGVLETFGLSPKKALQYLAVITTLTVIYFCYFVRDAKANACPPEQTITFMELGWLMVKFLVLTSWPFAVIAALESEWNGKDAGRVFLAAYGITNVLWYFKTGCAPCIFAAAFQIIPYTLCALLAHGLGTLRHRFA